MDDELQQHFNEAFDNFKSSVKAMPLIWNQGVSNGVNNIVNREKTGKSLPQVMGEEVINGLGTTARVALEGVKSIVGTGMKLFMPDKVEKFVTDAAAYTDTPRVANTVRSALNPGEKTVSPSNPNNQGFADPHWGLGTYTGLNVNDITNVGEMYFGAKAMKAAKKPKSRFNLNKTVRRSYNPVSRQNRKLIKRFALKTSRTAFNLSDFVQDNP